MIVGAVAGAWVAAKVVCGKFGVLALATSATAYNLWRLVASRQFTNAIGLILSAAAMALAYRERRRHDRLTVLEDVNGALRTQVEQFSALVDRNSRLIRDLEDRLGRQDAERLALEFHLAQSDAQALRDRGILAHSGHRDPLRPGTPPGSLRVLIVEDDPPTARTMARLLSYYGLTIEACRTAAEALALLRARRYDLILLDLILPDASGLDVLHAVRGPAAADVVVLSGTGDPGLLDRARRGGARAVLVKPIDLDELLALLGIPAGARPGSSDEIPAVPPPETPG